MGLRPVIAAAAQDVAPSRRYWAIVGNGGNRIAAEEVRIKLSELCYKAIACDGTEDKKHIDLSSEPLILVCAAGLQGSNVDDVAKEVAIYRAHKAAPVVVATEGEERFSAALHVIAVPAAHPQAGLRPLRHGRPPLRLRSGPGHRRPGPSAPRGSCGHRCGGRGRPTRRAGLRRAPGHVRRRSRPASSTGCAPVPTTATSRRRRRCGWPRTWRFALGMVPFEAYQVEHGKVGTPGVVLEDLAIALSRRHRRAHQADRCHQAPGQDRDRRHLPERRDAVAGPAGP